MNEKQTQQGANPLGVAPVGKLMVKFAIPSIVAMLVGAIYNIVDQFFIGQTVGELGNAATNVAFPLTTCCVALALCFGVGGAACFNLKMGAGEKEEAPYFVGSSLTALISSGVLLSAVTLIFLEPLMRLFGAPDAVLPYAMTYVRITALGFPFLILTTGGGHLIRADGSPQMTMICSLSGAIINVGLDALLVMGLHMGMAGAAIATVIGQVFSGLLVLWYMRFRFRTVALGRQHFLPKGRYLKRVTQLGTAPCFNQVAMILLQVVLNNSLTYYGAQSVYGESIPLACAGITMKVSQLCFGIIIGLGQGSQPIESFNYGAQQYRRVRQTYFMAAGTGAVIGVISFLLYQLLPMQILGLFGEGSDLYFQCGVRFFRIFLFMTWANFLQPISSTLFSSIGKPMKGVFLSLTRQVLFLIPLFLILPRFMGFDGLLYAGPIADCVALCTAVIMVALEFRSIRRLEREATAN